jgi:hypothetical protein
MDKLSIWYQLARDSSSLLLSFLYDYVRYNKQLVGSIEGIITLFIIKSANLL